jgi:enoyl-CoA hydratase/carnithine racemase
MGEHDDLVLSEVSEGICTLTLNNPSRRNAWNTDMENRYFDLLDEADADQSVRVIILTASGTIFCPGLDSQRLSATATAEVPRLDLRGRRPQTYPLKIRKPMLAAINGSAAGIGLMQTLNCDLRFCSTSAKFTTAYVRRGISAEYGSSWILPRVVGLENALDLLLSGRVIDAHEAKAMGLVSRVLEPDEVLPAARAYAQVLVEHCSPRSMAAIRRQVYADQSRRFEESILESMGVLSDFISSEDFAEGIASFVEKRPAAFPPLDPAFRVIGDMGY